MECSWSCQLQFGKPETAGDEWHHPDCYNHTTACCTINEQRDKTLGELTNEEVLEKIHRFGRMMRGLGKMEGTLKREARRRGITAEAINQATRPGEDGR